MSSTAMLEPPPYVWSITEPCRSTSRSCFGRDLKQHAAHFRNMVITLNHLLFKWHSLRCPSWLISNSILKKIRQISPFCNTLGSITISAAIDSEYLSIYGNKKSSLAWSHSIMMHVLFSRIPSLETFNRIQQGKHLDFVISGGWSLAFITRRLSSPMKTFLHLMNAASPETARAIWILPPSPQLWGVLRFVPVAVWCEKLNNSEINRIAAVIMPKQRSVCVCVCVCIYICACGVSTVVLTNSPCVVKLQRQVVPVFIVRWYHRLQGTWVVPSPTVTQVHNSVLTPTQLSPELRLACHQTMHLFFLRPKKTQKSLANL